MTTERARPLTPRASSTGEAGAARVVERYRRFTRWLHLAVYLTVLALLATGTWLLVGREGDPSPLSRLTGATDAHLHVWLGWLLVGVLVAGLLMRVRPALRFVAELTRLDSGDWVWFKRWPAAVLTGRFARHEGQLDPGQRLATIALVVVMLAAVTSGVAMAMLHGGPAFVWLVRIHRWSTYVLIPLLLGHIVIAAGILPGYRGVWRSMHLGGRLDVRVAHRLWPVWTERAQGGSTRSTAPQSDDHRHLM